MGVILTLPLSFMVNLLTLQMPGVTHWMKWMISYIYIFILKRITKKRFDLYDRDVENEPYKLGFLIPPEEIELESPFGEAHLHHAADEVLCYGVNSKSECLVARVARGCNQESEAWVYLKLTNGNTYRLPQDTSHYQQPYRDKCTNFSCGGLQMHYITPMRRWRIFFNGLLSETSKGNPQEERIVHVKFAFLWRASSDPFDFSSDMNISLSADALSAAKWNWPFPQVKRLYEMMNFYCQGGILMGTVRVGEDPEKEMFLWGGRMRYLGNTADVEGLSFLQILGNAKNGSVIQVGKSSIPNLVQNLHFGYVVQSNNSLNSLETCEIVSRDSDQGNDGNATNYYAKFKAGRDYQLDVKFMEKAITFRSDKGWGGYLDFNIVKLKLNEFQGSGIVIVGTTHETPKRPILRLSVPIIPKVVPIVVDIEEKICQIPDLTGGKGSSLGKLTEISGEVKTFVVPRGVVVTTAAYKEFLDNGVEEAVKALESVAYGKIDGDLKVACEKVSNVVSNKKMPDRLCHGIEQSLRRVFGGKINSIRFAVRSSATGEDTEQMSAAGQMDTYLGVKGLKEILTAVKKSWASQFGFIAVEYKRRYGQVLNSPMAVVIQEMVSCETAGVLFTCDPLTGNPGIISITANYGLGESVVSGSSEPDMVTLKRDIKNQLSVISTTVGDKSSKIVVNASGGTVEEVVDESKRGECCLSGESALRLAKIALSIEESYRSTRDLEWGILNDQIFLFQSRPVTSGSGETDFEIKHEFDGALRCEDEYLCVVNVGEVMPGSTSPLGLDVMMKYFGIAFQSASQRKYDGEKMIASSYFPIGILAMYNHMMFNLIDLVYRFDTEKMKTSVITQSTMVGMFGRILDDENMFAIARERYKGVKSKMHLVYYTLIWSLFFCGRYLRKVQKVFQNYRVPVEKFPTARDLFDNLTYRCSDLTIVMASHMGCTYSSSIWNMFMLSTLASNKGGFETEVYRDFAFLLSTCNDVESADVPAAMQSLAYAISQNIDPVAFKAMDIEEALEWLQNSKTSAGNKFRNFLLRHGHRCLKEFDLHSVTWGMDPRPLVKLLQGMAGSVSKDTVEKEVMSTNEVLSNLSVPLKFKYRQLMKFLLPYGRQGVQQRESSKSLMIKGIDRWRNAYHRLAELMVFEGRIPDKDLFFFFTVDELDELLKTRSPKLISKAFHRRRLFPEMDKYIFPEIMKGYPVPVNMDPVEPTVGEFTMKGVPVSQGVVRATVRVAMTLEEAASLKAGEILITYSTDIGWSPYFPILSGVVTELGGLISHGAVVAREYGLPCVVGLHGATRKFQTGDYVLLDGSNGILQKLPKEKTN